MPDRQPRLTFVERTGSTNADLLAALRLAGVAEGDWRIADRQYAGRGRQGRTWLDAPGNFMGSTAVALSAGDPPPHTLSFVAALAVYEAVLPLIARPDALMLKWPNDVLLQGAKFCGLLLEREGNHAVIGIGVNLVAIPAVEGRDVRALAQFGPPPPRDDFAKALARRFLVELAQWRENGVQALLDRWQAAAHQPGAELSVHDGAGARISGTFAGLAGDGALKLHLADGTMRVIHAGDVTIGGE